MSTAAEQPDKPEQSTEPVEATAEIAEPTQINVSVKPTVTGKVFAGFHLAIFGWLLVHTLLYFWDVLIPWNITFKDHFWFNGSFMLYILLLGATTLGLWRIWGSPEYSDINASRIWFILCAVFAPVLLFFSNMAGEPLNKIGSAWFGGNDLRYPSFMTQPYFLGLALFFVIDMSVAIASSADDKSSTHLFRPYKDHRFVKEWMDFGENWRGILACAYIYVSYWFVFMVVSRSWVERVIIYICILMARNSFGMPASFEQNRKTFYLLFVPVYALVRGYYAYDEYLAYELRWAFAVKMAYCLSQVVIFAGWYSDARSTLASWTVPFMRLSPNEEGERVVLEPTVELKKED